MEYIMSNEIDDIGTMQGGFMKPTRIIFLAVLFQYSCGNAINPVLAPLAIQTGMNVVETGLFFTLSSLMWLVASPYWGRQSDRIGRKRVMLIGLGTCFLLYMLFGLVSEWGLTYHPSALLLFVFLLLIRIVSGVFFSTVPVAAQAYIADTTTGIERTRAVTLVWMASGLGAIAGPALGWISKYHLMTPLYVGSLLALLGFATVWLFLPHNAISRTTAKINSKISPFDRRVWRYFFIISSLQASILAIQVTTGFFIEQNYHFSANQTARIVGLFFILSGFVSLLSQLLFVRTFKMPSKLLLRIGTPIMVLSCTMFFFHVHIQAIYCGFILLGMATGLILPGAASGASLSVKQTEQGAVAGRISAAQGLGTAVGPLIGTYLYQYNSMYPYIFTVCLFLIASFLVWRESLGMCTKRVYDA